MNSRLDLQKIEKNAFRSTYQDGLLDINFGLIVIFMALYLYRPPSGYSPLNIFLMLAGFLVSNGLFWAGKKWITFPRMGQAAFGEVRKRRERTMAIVLGIFILLQTAMVVVTALGIPSLSAALDRLFGTSDHGLLVVASIGSLMVGSGMMVMVYFSDFLRGYYIVVLMAAVVFVMILYNKPLIPILTGALIITPGIILLIRFIRQHPVPREVDFHE